MDVVLTCCKDESDVIGTFIEFYLDMGFDAIYLVENGSSDNTAEIIESYKHKYPVFVKYDDRLGYELRLKEYYCWAASTNPVRWIFFIDCDEFIFFPRGITHYLKQLDNSINCIRLRQREMHPIQPKTKEFGWFLYTKLTAKNFDNTVKEVSRYSPHAKIYSGKHKIDLPNKHLITPKDIFIRHYSYRSPEQAKQKELNRVAVHNCFSDEDLKEISAFSVGISRNWQQYKRNYLKQEGWQEYFDGRLQYNFDNTMVNWIKDYSHRRTWQP